jgi:hypothetical protein
VSRAGSAISVPVLGRGQAMLEPEMVGHSPHVTLLLGTDECDPDAGPAGTSRTADAMDVGLAVGGRVEVDHVGDPVDVDPAGRDIGGDERVDGSGLEPGERLLALTL